MKMKRSRTVLFVNAALAAVVLALTFAVSTNSAFSQSGSRAAQLVGQSNTLLTDGTLLAVGGEGFDGPSSGAWLTDPTSGTHSELAARLHFPRAWHSATVLADGTVAIIGGLGPDREIIQEVERFDPKGQIFSLVSVPGLTRRSHHSATLLTDGTILIVGGTSKNGTTLGSAQLWNPETNAVVTLARALHIPRSGHTATLQPDGNVLIKGGVDATSKRILTNELYDPTTQTFREVKNESSSNSDLSAPVVSGTLPVAGAQNVSLTTNVSIRFSQPVDVTSVDSDTITLSGPSGNVASQVVAAEGGRLVFVDPDSPLAPGTVYTVSVDGVSGAEGIQVPAMSFDFTTAAKSLVGPSNPSTPGGGGAGENWPTDPEAWIPSPNGDWRTHRAPSPWQSLPPYLAPRGVTALSGQVLTLDGMPLAGVTLEVGNRRAMSDPSGRFLLLGLTPGQAVLLIDGTTANNNVRTYGTFQVGVSLAARQTTVLSFTIWMPLLDTLHAITIPSPTSNEIVVMNPLMPGLQLHIPAGTVIRDLNGQVVRTITMTPVPLDRPPFPLPIGVQVPIYFTIQPGGSQLWTTQGTWAWAQLYYPNPEHLAPGTRFDFWNYNASGSGWYVYGHGVVSSDGTEVIPDAGVGIWNFTGAMVGGPAFAPPSPNPPPNKCPGGNGGQGGSGGGGGAGSPSAGDPVDCSTGIFLEDHTDVVLNDVIPIQFTRTYRTADTRSRPFGVGGTDNYEIFLVGNTNPYTYQDLILPNGARIYYPRISSGTDYPNAVYQNSSAPGLYFGSTISWNGHGWNLQLKDGTVYAFPDGAAASNPGQAAVTSITDRYANQVNIARDSNGNITQITSPNGRWLQFQHDSSNRITQIQDNIGRTISYAYDTCQTGMLCKVTDANGGLTSYTYDASDRMLTMTDPRGSTVFTNQYDTAGRVHQQTLADGTSTWQFGYSIDSNGNVSQTTITDPNGIEEQKGFTEFHDTGSGNYTGFITSDVRAVGKNEQQTTTYSRDPNTNLITSMTDQLNRQTSYSFDSLGNVLTVTYLSGTQNAITYTCTYTSNFSELASVTDPLGHEWTASYDNSGNLTSLTAPSPVSNQINFSYNFMGQMTSVSQVLNNTTQLTTQFGYNYGDLSQVTDPLNNITKLFTDGEGRAIGIFDPLGNQTQYSYDNLDHLTQTVDANNRTTSFGYDGNGNLLSVTDASNNKTTYAYDARNRPMTRTDALNQVDNYQYDGNSNVTQYTDRRGNVDAFGYDGLNRRTFDGFGKTGSTYQDTISYTWDGGDRVTQAVDSAAGTIGRTYDGLDRLTQEATRQGTINYTYDSAGRRATMQVVGQSQVTYTWDNADRLTGIVQGSQSVGFSYDNANRRTCLTLPNGVLVSYGYDSDSHPTSLTYGTGGSCTNPPSNLGNLTYVYDADGHRVATNGSLSSVALPGNVAGGSSTTYNADNEQSKFNGTTLSYDSNGNLTGDGTNTYTWDARNHLTAITGGSTASFVYDAFGRRMSKSLSGATTQFLYDMLKPVQELNGGSGVVANLLTGLNIDEYFTRTDTATSTLVTDALGSTIGIVGAGGTIATNYTYQPFGATTAGGATNGNSYEFTGRENDGNGLYFYRARYYSPTYQRFIAQDPIEFASEDSNLYEYTLGDPIDLSDPFGLRTTVPLPPPWPKGRWPWVWPPAPIRPLDPDNPDNMPGGKTPGHPNLNPPHKPPPPTHKCGS